MPKIAQLVGKSADGKHLEVKEDAIRILESHDKPLVVVGIAGKSREGKSFLANFIMDSDQEFPLGCETRPKTMGIWMGLVDHPLDKNKSLLILDTEGLNHPDGSREIDTWIFTLTTLLSETLIFNVMRNIDDDAIKILKIVCTLTNHVKVKTSSGKATIADQKEFHRWFPRLVFTIRDFELTPKVKGLDRIATANEYMDDCLTAQDMADLDPEDKSGMEDNMTKTNTKLAE